MVIRDDYLVIAYSHIIFKIHLNIILPSISQFSKSKFCINISCSLCVLSTSSYLIYSSKIINLNFGFNFNPLIYDVTRRHVSYAQYFLSYLISLLHAEWMLYQYCSWSSFALSVLNQQRITVLWSVHASFINTVVRW